MEARSPLQKRRSGANTASLAPDLPNNTAVDVLGDHWKSALCVTSLYDSYVALQHENESLKEQLRHVQHTNELLAVETRSLTVASANKQLRIRPESEVDQDDDDSALVKEIRLLRAEKSQQELLFDKRRVQLENELNEYKALYTQQQLKYQEKFDLDPLEPQRVALSTRTLQDALDEVVREKEELVIKHSKLQQLYVALEQDHKQTTAMLQAQVADMESRRVAQATHRVRGVLEKWVLTKVSHSWKQWRLVVLSERLQAKQREEERARQELLVIKKRSVIQERAAKMVGKLLQSMTRRCFSEWKYRVQTKKIQRRHLLELQQRNELKVSRQVFELWKDEVMRQRSISEGCQRLTKLMERRGKTRAWRKWTHVPLCVQNVSLRSQNGALQAALATSTDRVSELSRLCGSLQAERDELKVQLQDGTDTSYQHLTAVLAAHDVAFDRIALVLHQRSQRLQLRQCFLSWREAIRKRVSLKLKIKAFSHHHESKKIRESVRHWAESSQEQKRMRQITGRFLRRMRMVSAYRCFMAWREFATTKKERIATIKRVVLHMKNQQLIKCFTTWRAFREEYQAKRRCLAKMCFILERLETTSYFSHWKMASVALSAAAEHAKRKQMESEWKQRLEQSKQELKQLRQYFHTWQKTTKNGKRFRQLTTKCAIKWKNGTLGKCLEAWKAFVVGRARARELLGRLAMRRETSELVGAWTRWRTQALIKAKELTLQDLERERAAQIERLQQELAQMRLEQSALQATSAVREQSLVLELHALRDSLLRLRDECAQYKGCLKAVCSSVSERRIVMKWLRAWQQWVARRKHHRQLVETTTAIRDSRSMKRAFDAWNGQRRKRLKMTAMVKSLLSRWHEYTLADCYRAWARYAHKRASIRQAAKTFSENSQQRLRLSVFIAWKGDARKTRLLRKTLEQIWLTSVHVHMQECFTRWVELAKDASVKESVARREQVLASIQAKICGRWTACSLKAVFGAWKQGVAIQKRAQLGQERLHKLHQLRLLAITFTEWKALRSQVKSQYQWLEKWQLKQETKSLKEALSQWKAVSVTRREEEVASLKANRETQLMALAAKTEEVAKLSGENEVIHSRLEALSAAHTSMELLTERLGKRAVVVKWFQLWRIFVQTATSSRLQLKRFQSRREARLQRTLLRDWRGLVNDRHATDVDARRFERARSLKQLRSVWQAWRSITQSHLQRKRVVRRLLERRQRAQRRALFEMWKVSTGQSQAMRRVVNSLQHLTVKVSLAGGFARWKQATLVAKQEAAQEIEKKRRVMMMMMARVEFTMSKCFAAWKAVAMARLERMKHVARLCERNRRRCLAQVLQSWRRSIAESQIEVDGTQRLVWLYKRQRLRLGFRRWSSHITQLRLDVLGAETVKLTRTNESLQSELQQQSHQVHRLATEVETLGNTCKLLQVEKEQSISATETTWAAKSRESQLKYTLTKLLLLHHHVPQSAVAVSSAFQQWKSRATIMSNQLKALQRCSHLLMRKSQARAFSFWRRRVAAYDKLERLVETTSTRQSRTAWNAWREYIRERSTRRRRFVVRWIEVTHTLQAQHALGKKTTTAFRVWQLQAQLASAHQNLNQATETQLRCEKASAQKHRERLLAKWAWRAYTTRCSDLRTAVSRWKSIVQGERADTLELQIKQLQAKVTGNPTGLDESTASTIAQGLQTLFRRLASVSSAQELFEGVATVFPQLLHRNISAMLYLLDPSTNELWTYSSNSQQITRVSASLGIAGYALSTQGCVLTPSASTNPRFHPVVDQVANVGSSLQSGSTNPPPSLLSTTIVASDGNTYGVLQVAFQPTDDSADRMITTQIQLVARICAFFVEQILYEMVRHCRDRLRARSPDAFAKLFKQNKNWRKYFVQVEREAQKTHQQLQQILVEQELLENEKARQQQIVDQAEADRRALREAQEKTEQHGHTQEQLMKYVSAYKKKTAKVKEVMLAKDQELVVKSHELERVATELAEVRRQMRMLEWQTMLSGKTATVSPKKKKKVETEDTSDEVYATKRGGLLKGAEVATLKNELVRAESDSMLLVKAVDVATRHHGELPETLKMEVNRIALRLKKTVE